MRIGNQSLLRWLSTPGNINISGRDLKTLLYESTEDNSSHWNNLVSKIADNWHFTYRFENTDDNHDLLGQFSIIFDTPDADYPVVFGFDYDPFG